MSTTRNIQTKLALEQQLAAKEEELNAMILAQRNEEVRRIEREIQEICALMRDIQALVADQGIMIDAIDNNVTKAADNTQAGVENLREASEHQQKRRKRTAIIIAVVVATVLVAGGGALISAALGMTGVLGFLAGAAIMLAGLAVLAGLAYGAYSLIKCCMPKSDNHERSHEVVSQQKRNHKGARQAPTISNRSSRGLQDSNAASAGKALFERRESSSIKRDDSERAFLLPQSMDADVITGRDANTRNSMLG